MYTLISLLIITFGFQSKIQALEPFNERTLNGVASLQLRTDGQFEAICKNGQRDIVTTEELSKNDVCGTPTVPRILIISAQSRDDKRFDIVCRDNTKENGTVIDITSGKSCQLSGHQFFGMKNLVGTDNVNLSTGFLVFRKITISAEKTPRYWGVNIPNRQIDPLVKMAVYNDNNGKPGTIALAPKTFDVGTEPGIYLSEADPTNNLTPGTYWLAFTTDAKVILGKKAIVQNEGYILDNFGFGNSLPIDLSSHTLTTATHEYSVFIAVD